MLEVKMNKTDIQKWINETPQFLDSLNITKKEFSSYNLEEQNAWINEFKHAQRNSASCKQYSYTSISQVLKAFKDRNLNKGIMWLEVKAGQTFRTVEKRINEQYSTSNTELLIALDQTVESSSDDLKLDDKIRAKLESSRKFKNYTKCDLQTVHKTARKHEWIKINIYALLIAAKINPDDENAVTNILNNKVFIKLLSTQLEQDKKEALILLKQNAYKIYVPRPWQEKVQEELIKANKRYILLSLAPRWGKTLGILGYCKCLSKLDEHKDKRVLIVLVSKAKSANSSFVNSFKLYGFNRWFSILDASLFKSEENLEKEITTKLQDMKADGYKDIEIVFVTDEADVASHTGISIKKMNLIRKLPGVTIIKHIAMSGTGIAKASKIFKSVPSYEIKQITCAYADLLNDYYSTGLLVKRNLVQVVMDINKISSAAKEAGRKGKDILNFRQSFQHPFAFDSLSEMIDMFASPEKMRKTKNKLFRSMSTLKLNDSEVVMVFVPLQRNTELETFVKYFKENFSDEYEVMTISGSGDATTNAKAEETVTKRITKMYKESNTKKLILFSKGMANRSFSIPEIKKVIMFDDTEMSNAGYQASSRGLTYDDTKGGEQSADIIRLTFDKSLSLSIENAMNEYLVEDMTDDPQGDPKSFFVSKFLANTTITELIAGNPEPVLTNTILENTNGLFMDKVMKFSNLPSILAVRWIDKNIKCDGYSVSSDKSVTKLVDDKTKHNKLTDDKEESEKDAKQKKDNEAALRAYAAVVRELPYAFMPLKLDKYDLDIILEHSDAFEVYIPQLKKDEFIDNLSVAEFKTSVESIITEFNMSSPEEQKERFLEFLKIEIK